MASSMVIRMADKDGRKIFLRLCESGKMILGCEINGDRFVPMLVKGRHTATAERSIYFVQKRQGPRVFCRDIAGQWTAFRDTFQLGDERESHVWYGEVHKAIMDCMSGSTNLMQMLGVLRKLGSSIGITTTLETHDLR